MAQVDQEWKAPLSRYGGVFFPGDFLLLDFFGLRFLLGNGLLGVSVSRSRRASKASAHLGKDRFLFRRGRF